MVDWVSPTMTVSQGRMNANRLGENTSRNNSQQQHFLVANIQHDIMLQNKIFYIPNAKKQTNNNIMSYSLQKIKPNVFIKYFCGNSYGHVFFTKI